MVVRDIERLMLERAQVILARLLNDEAPELLRDCEKKLNITNITVCLDGMFPCLIVKIF
ncbi:MAG: hypothetical protein KDA78_11215 [Planctomycetaceae bacterium]|nr:hypothetical protein [Planctomycetaceae bacterium]